MKHILTLATLVFATSCFGQEACPNVHDINSNGTIDIEDFLSILGLFADVDVDEDGVWDSEDACLDASACNYLASPTEPCSYLDALGECGGACEGDGDGDGICDDVDTCVGELDECGVCNGTGPTEVVIEDITILYDSVYLTQLEEWYVYEFGADTTFSYECVQLFDCGDPVSYQGYNYSTVLIGEQCWFRQNLRSENYENGDPIPSGLSSSEWGASSGAVAVYGEGSSICDNDGMLESGDFIGADACDEVWSLGQFGRLYNWYAVDDARGLCPSGWHVPTDIEWTVLADELGGYDVAGNEMKCSCGWHDGNSGTNSSDFDAKPGGRRRENGNFDRAGYNAFWWSSTLNNLDAWCRKIRFDSDLLWTELPDPSVGLSIRCLKDSE